jgi:hypothetical protein
VAYAGRGRRLTTTIRGELHKRHLAGPADRQLQASGVFYFDGAVCDVTFSGEHGLSTFLDFYLAHGDSDVVTRLYLTPQGEKFPSANLRFQFDRDRQVAAAVLIAADRHDQQYSWMTRGTAGHGDVTLAHDTWNPDDTRMPPEAFITISELRETLTQWLVGDVLPPRPALWTEVPDVRWF